MIPGTYTQIYLQFVIVVKYREALIQPKYQEEVFPFIAGLINAMGHKTYAVNGMPDHVHLFMSVTPSKSPAETIKEIKRATTNFSKEARSADGRGLSRTNATETRDLNSTVPCTRRDGHCKSQCPVAIRSTN